MKQAILPSWWQFPGLEKCWYSDLQRVLKHEDDSTLLRAYISEWSKFFTQCNYLPKPFGTLESNLQGKAGGGASKRPLTDGITVQKVCNIDAACRIRGFMAILYWSTGMRFLCWDCQNFRRQPLPTFPNSNSRRFPRKFGRFLKTFCTFLVPVPNCPFPKLMPSSALFAFAIGEVYHHLHEFFFSFIGTNLHTLWKCVR